jgi:hypothetical protein
VSGQWWQSKSVSSEYPFRWCYYAQDSALFPLNLN